MSGPERAWTTAMMASSSVQLNDRQGYTVKRAGEWLVEICPMLFNYRIVLTPVDCPDAWEHGWCYFGRDQATLLRAWAAAELFDPATQSAPMGYDKALTSRK